MSWHFTCRYHGEVEVDGPAPTDGGEAAMAEHFRTEHPEVQQQSAPGRRGEYREQRIIERRHPK